MKQDEQTGWIYKEDDCSLLTVVFLFSIFNHKLHFLETHVHLEHQVMSLSLMFLQGKKCK